MKSVVKDLGGFGNHGIESLGSVVIVVVKLMK